MSSLHLPPAEADALQETLLGEALEHGPVGAMVLDESGRYLAANRLACQLTGYDRNELLNLNASDLAVDPQTVPGRLAELTSGELDEGSTQLRRKDGTILSVEYRVGATRSGGLPYFVVVFWEAEGS
jgi:PAS domain S-box-containing protein